MNYVEISDLLSKGFTPDQIVMLAGANPPEPEHSEDKNESAGEDLPQKHEHSEDKNESAGEDLPQKHEHSEDKNESAGEDLPQKPEHSPEPSPEMKALRDEMKALKEAIQAQNIITQHMETLPPSSESTESILAGIIRPPFENKKD